MTEKIIYEKYLTEINNCINEYLQIKKVDNTNFAEIIKKINWYHQDIPVENFDCKSEDRYFYEDEIIIYGCISYEENEIKTYVEKYF